jgi:prepilin-type N-terminal cleavage/methylation domain-containing protein
VRNGRQPPAFTLIELLVVIAIITILAGFTLFVITGIEKTKNVKIATAELEQIEMALENYQHKYGSYPPSNAAMSPLENTLYYELSGVYLTNLNGGTYTTLDGASTITTANYASAFTYGGSSIGGIINCTHGSAEEGTAAQDFLTGLAQNRVGTSTCNGQNIQNLITSVRGPLPTYQPLSVQDVNPFRYVYPGTNNPKSYDLWVQIVLKKGTTNLICNWTKQVIVNSPLP